MKLRKMHELMQKRGALCVRFVSFSLAKMRVSGVY